MGLAFFLGTAGLLPLNAVALTFAVGALGFRAERRRGYGPLLVGLLAASLVVVGKFALDFALVTFVGIALLLAASVWNSWPIKVTKSDLVPLRVRSGDP